MPVVIKKGDIFTNNNSNRAWFHCGSSDLELGKGIALKFVQRFGREGLDSHPHDVGDVTFMRTDEGRLIFVAITKNRYWDKPTVQTMRAALERARDLLAEMGVDHIAMPKIGCGLDRLDWKTQVLPLVQGILGPTIDVLVYEYVPARQPR